MAKNWKMAMFWIVGALCMMMGSVTVNNALNGTDTSYLLNMTFSFILFLLGGILWIAVSIAMRNKFA